MASSFDLDVTNIDPSNASPDDVKKLLALVPEAQNMKKALDAERNQRKELQKTMDTFKSELDQLKTEKEKSQSEKEKLELEKKGDIEAYKKKVAEEHAAVLQKLEGEKGAMKQQLHTLLVKNEVLSAAKSAVNPDDVYSLMSGSFRVDEKDGKFSVAHLDSDGTIALDDKGQPLTVDGAVSKFLETRPYLVKSDGKGGSGTPLGGAGGKDEGSQFTYKTMQK